MDEHGIGQRVQRQGTGTVGVRHRGIKLHRAGHVVYRGNKGIALQYRIHNTWIERLIGIASVLHLFVGRGHISVSLRPFFSQCLMSRLVQQVRTTQADKQHLQHRILDEYARHDTRYRQQVFFQSQRLRLACEYTQ